MFVRARSIFEELSKYVMCGGKVDDSQSKQLLDLLSNNSSLLTNILKNAGKSAAHRAELEPNKIVNLPSGQSVQVDADVRNEALIISDIFNCDELDALELISTGESHSHKLGNWARGLCAVVYYYDTHRVLSAVTKVLIEMKYSNGVHITPAMSTFLTQFCTNPALAKRLIEVAQMSVAYEMQMLHRPNVNGLGSLKHQELLRQLIEETISNCRSSLYLLCSSWSNGSVPPFLVDLLNPLRELRPTSSFTDAHLCAWTALLMLIPPQNTRNATSSVVILSALQKEFKGAWSDLCLLSSLQLACVVSCAWVNANCSLSQGDEYRLPDEDELSKQLKKALNAMALPFLRCSIIKAPGFRDDPTTFRVLDTIVKLLIVHFSDKLVMLRRACEDELAGMEVTLTRGILPDSPLHFEKFLRLIADLYDNDSPFTATAASQFLSIENPALSKFLRGCKEIISPVLQITCLDMLKNLCRGREMASFIFRIMCTSHRGTSDMMSFNHFCWAIRGYLETFKRQKLSSEGGAFKKKFEMDQQLVQEEVAGLIAWTQLAAAVALHDPYASRQFASDSMLLVNGMIGMLATSIPLVVKGAFYRFLAVLARDGMVAEKIWVLLKNYSVLSVASDGKLLGIQQELEERECSLRKYDSTLGFLHLLRALMLHPVKTFDDGHVLPYIRFVTKSIISQFLYRSYENEEQMWELCMVSCDALCNLLKYYVVTDASLLNAHPQIAAVLVRGSIQFENYVAHRYEPLEACCLSVLRLLYTCASQHAILSEAIRSSKSNVIIASLDSLLLDRLSADSEGTYMAAIASFIMQSEHLPLHSFWAAKILRELSASRPTLQTEITYCLMPLGNCFIEECAKITSPGMKSLNVSTLDAPVLYDIETLPVSRIHGEIARILIEICTTSIEMDPNNANLGYFLCGFNMTNLLGTRLENPGINGTTRTCLHSVVDALQMLISTERPYNLSYSALFEPMLRFLLRLVSANESYGELVLRFLRSNNDLMFSLLACDAVSSCDLSTNDEEESIVMNNTKRMIQGYVLHLNAIELHSLLKIRHYSQPARLYSLLLSRSNVDGTAQQEITSDASNGHTRSDQVQRRLTSSPVDSETVVPLVQPQSLSSIEPVVSNYLLNSRTSSSSAQLTASSTSITDFTECDPTDIAQPSCPPINVDKSVTSTGYFIQIASLCDRVTASDVLQCDIERMHWLLQREALSVIGEMQQEGIDTIAQEVHEILRYCVAYNLLRGASASSLQLLSGWLSIVNVMAAFVPVPFIAMGILTNAACYLYEKSSRDKRSLRHSVAQMLVEMIRCVIRPGSLPYQNRRNIYLCILRLLTSVAKSSSSKEDTSGHGQENSFDMLEIDEPRADPIRAVVNLYAYELVKLVKDDLCCSSFDLKVMSLLCVARLLREDLLGSQTLAHLFLRNGLLRCVLESITKTCVSGTQKTTEIRFLEHLKAVLILFIPLAICESGWKGLFEEHGLEILAALPHWKTPPKQIFIDGKGNDPIAELFLEVVQLKIELCLAVCANSRWRCICDKVSRSLTGFYGALSKSDFKFIVYFQALCLVSCSTELLSHLMRSDPYCSLIQTCAMFISRVYEAEEQSRDFIRRSTCLDAIRSVPLDKTLVDQQSSCKTVQPSFNTPRRLFNTEPDCA
ncbi:unnamed protein product [Anisakis simplex]|uniref:Nuclear pore complex protein Nup205 (inferred by orthology to a human protein) n=1 Tax=Anisakis simplex TaxID=6269 RepID=A0A158PMZ6_ANISI|nr:unnamed protein product [Anisakis simplex]